MDQATLMEDEKTSSSKITSYIKVISSYKRC